jgi:secondary thiamine-phosphate synthase enzyme
LGFFFFLLRGGGGVGGRPPPPPPLNDDEPGLHQHYKKWLEWLAPYDPSPERYNHNKTGEDNGDAHHKRQVMGREVVVAITKGKLDCGPWEQIFYGEFDGRRAKRVLVKVIGE